MSTTTLAVFSIIALAGAMLSLMVYAYTRAADAMIADARVAELARALGGSVLGKLQWVAPRAGAQVGLVVQTGRPGIARISLWLSHRPAAPPRLVLRLLHEYDEPLRAAFAQGQAERLVLRRRSRLFRWARRRSSHDALALGELATELRVASATSDDVVRAALSQPAIRSSVLGALAVGFDELVLYPPVGVELVVHSPRASMLLPEVVHAALSWLERMAPAISRSSP